jgi:arsenite oxidase large subunit
LRSVHGVVKSNDFVQRRVQMAYLEINPEDAQALAIESGDVVEVFNDYGSSYALAYLEADIKRNQTFMQLGHYNGGRDAGCMEISEIMT